MRPGRALNPVQSMLPACEICHSSRPAGPYVLENQVLNCGVAFAAMAVNAVKFAEVTAAGVKVVRPFDSQCIGERENDVGVADL